jgi:branched-chain amino acid transport system substrate-binding protein
VQWHQQQVPALFDGINASASSSDFWSATNGATDGLITTSAGLSGAAVTSRTAGFYKAYQQRFHINQPAYGAYSTYEAMYALADALKRTQGKAKGDALVKALETTNIEGVMGRISFYGLDSPFAHELVADADPAKGASVVAFQWQQGKQVIVWPQRLATGKIQVPGFVPTPKP